MLRVRPSVLRDYNLQRIETRVRNSSASRIAICFGHGCLSFVGGNFANSLTSSNQLPHPPAPAPDSALVCAGLRLPDLTVPLVGT